MCGGGGPDGCFVPMVVVSRLHSSIQEQAYGRIPARRLSGASKGAQKRGASAGDQKGNIAESTFALRSARSNFRDLFRWRGWGLSHDRAQEEGIFRAL